MRSITVRTTDVSMSAVLSQSGMRFTIYTDGNNALYVQPMTDNWERDYGDDRQYARQNFPYTFKLKVRELRDGSIIHTPVLSANFKRHYGTVLTGVLIKTLREYGMGNR